MEYNRPELEIFEIDAVDVIMASNPTEDGGNEEEGFRPGGENELPGA